MSKTQIGITLGGYSTGICGVLVLLLLASLDAAAQDQLVTPGATELFNTGLEPV